MLGTLLALFALGILSAAIRRAGDVPVSVYGVWLAAHTTTRRRG